MELSFNRNKYLDIAKTTGYSAAVTALHQDLQAWENDTFESQEGYNPEKWAELEVIRSFSRELWETALAIPTKNHRNN